MTICFIFSMMWMGEDQDISFVQIVKVKDIIPPMDKEKFNDVYIVYELMDTDLHQIIRSKQALTDDHCQVNKLDPFSSVIVVVYTVKWVYTSQAFIALGEKSFMNSGFMLLFYRIRSWLANILYLLICCNFPCVVLIIQMCALTLVCLKWRNLCYIC